jgi:hypothetical protein
VCFGRGGGVGPILVSLQLLGWWGYFYLKISGLFGNLKSGIDKLIKKKIKLY